MSHEGWQLAQQEARRAFEEKHGVGESLLIGGEFIWPDGARMGESMFGMLQEPARDEAERLKTMIVYHEELAKRAHAAYAERQQYLVNKASVFEREGFGNPDPDGREMASLRKLRQDVIAKVRTLTKLQEKLENTPAALARRAEAEYVAQSRQQAASFKQSVLDERL